MTVIQGASFYYGFLVEAFDPATLSYAAADGTLAATVYRKGSKATSERAATVVNETGTGNYSATVSSVGLQRGTWVLRIEATSVGPLAGDQTALVEFEVI